MWRWPRCPLSCTRQEIGVILGLYLGDFKRANRGFAQPLDEPQAEAELVGNYTGRSGSIRLPCDTISVGGQQLMDVIAALQDEAARLKKQLDTVLHAMHLLGKGKSKKVAAKRRRMSAAGKAKIAAAQKKRWAKVRAAKKKAA